MNKLVIANWKQNKSLKETKDWIFAFNNILSTEVPKVDMIVAPSFPFLHVFQDLRTKIGNFYVSSQDVSAYPAGRHTGEVGADQLKDFVEYSIIGHSERKEDLNLVLQKGAQLFEAGITPIMCFVEFDPKMYAEGTILAWEDPENISTDAGYKEKSISEIAAKIAEIRTKLPSNAKLLYGGSVNRQNALELSNIVGLDGVLIGNASLDPSHFFEIIKAFDK